MTSHVEQQIAARIARARAEEERKRQVRAEFAKARARGLAARHGRKLRQLAERGFDLAPLLDPYSNATPSASGG
ncbi:hypothetical protein ABTY96_28425 [Streptomyces sp. NPDC096057]|uniref:hypothetical protein n=1 Tax=Streptomyces sp. NPDC096057 TaxID=3155543 RepID=UPI00331E1430